MPSGGSVFYSFVFFLSLSLSLSHPFCPVDGTSITRVVFVIARGRDTEGKDTKRRNGGSESGACERWKENFEEARGLAACGLACERLDVLRDFVLTREVCVSFYAV